MMDVVRRLQGQGYAAWCPLGIKQRTHARKTVMRLEPLFSPVLFVGLRVDQGIAAMVQTTGIMDVVRSDSRRPLTISAIERGRIWAAATGSEPCRGRVRQSTYISVCAVSLKQTFSTL